MTRKHVKMSWLRVSRSVFPWSRYHADTTTVDSRPIAPHWVRQTVAPVRPPTQSKWTTTKGKAASHPVTRLQPRKVTRIMSPTPEVMVPTTPVAGPSRLEKVALFMDPVVSGDEGGRGSVPATL